ncbi:MAG TPA: hypothetical protein VEJ89_15645 [Myxococcaceae bacterium]|nr:hypothetical protein [Myxococcaceae bacterium]
MRRSAVLVLLLPSLALGQTAPATSPPPSTTPPASGELTPPPLIEAAPDTPLGSPTPAPPGSQPPPYPTPYPPTPYGATPPGMYPGYGSPYGVPYGQQSRLPPPGPEVGLMVTETLFGALTAAGISLLPYFLILQPSSTCSGTAQYYCSTFYIDPTVQTILTIVIFGAVPLAVAETQLGIANGSRYYVSEAWPAMLTGLGVEGLVLGVSYWVNQSNGSAAEWILLAGTVGVVPLATMAVINMTKQPRFRMTVGPPPGAFLSYSPESGLFASLPMPEPLVRPGTAVRGSPFSGVGVPLLRGVW